MKDIFDKLLRETIAPYFAAIGFETKDINSETNKTLGAESFYFYRIENGLNKNFYFETNYDHTPQKFQFKLDFGIYCYDFYQKIGFPTHDEANGLGCTFSLTADSMSENNTYWQDITPQTVVNTLAENLLKRIQNTLAEFQKSEKVENLLPQFLAKQGSLNINYDQMIRYLKITDNQPLLDEYVAQIRKENSDGTDSSKWFLQQIENALSTVVLKQKIIQNFTAGMKIPKSWEKVLDWVEKNPHQTISGLFEIHENSNEMLPYWCDVNGNAIKKLGVIGVNCAQDIFCIWQKDKKNMPIVWIGEGGLARIITENIDDFIQLLAVGYYEVEQGDYANAPIFEDYNAQHQNPEFQAFYQ